MSEIIEEISKLHQDNPALTVAIVGSGGKTTLMRQLGEQLDGLVLCTTSTKLGTEQAAYFDQHLIWNVEENEPPYFAIAAKSILISSGFIGEADHQRINNLSPKQFDVIRQLCLEKQLPLIIEADGAKCKSLKAPADWEPVIPEFSDLVVVVVGLRDLMKPLNEEIVFHSEIFSEISGLSLGEPINMDAICRYLKHPLGGLKGIPNQVKRFVYFVTANCENLQLIDKYAISKVLQNSFDRILFSD